MTSETIKKKVASYLGLARKSGNAALGTEQVIAAARKPGASEKTAAVIASDASERTKKQLNDKCAFYGVTTICDIMTGDEIARAVGKKMTVSAAAVTEKNLASALKGLVSGE